MIGEIIKRARLSNHMTVTALAKASGVPATRISEQEREIKCLKIEDLFKIDHVLDHDVIWDLANYYDEVFNDTHA